MKQLIIAIIFSSISVLSLKAQKTELACDFSNYKPLVISHALLNAAVKKVQPQYPPAARYVRVEGQVLVKILVDRKGNVAKACVVNGHPLLRAAAKKAALEWKFKENFGFSKKLKKWRFVISEIRFNFKSN